MMKNKILPSAAALIYLTACGTTISEPENQRPNVILIYADDLGKGMISSYGQKQMTTPNIDKIVNQGIKFTNAYSSAYSAPARFSLLTGYNDCRNDKYSVSRGGPYCVIDTMLIAQREDSLEQETIPLASNDLHLAQVFKKAGYKTGATGKLEWGFLSTRKQMSQRGWDYYYGYLDHQRCHGFYPPFLFENGEIVMLEGNTHANAGLHPSNDTPQSEKIRWNMSGKKQFSEYSIIDKALQFIRENKDEPFFLYLPSLLPHGPISTPIIDPELAANKNLTKYEQEYGSMVKILDQHVAKIFDELKTQGIEDNTMIIFAADNGHCAYYLKGVRTANSNALLANGKEHDDYKAKFTTDLGGDIYDGNGGTAGLKRSSLDGGVNIPFAIYWKGKLKPRVCEEFIATYDLLPTFAKMFGVELETEKSGVTLDKVIFEEAKLPKDRTIIVDSQQRGPMIVNNEGWKLRYIDGEDCFELFNVEEDVQESNDLIDKHPEIAQKLRKKLEEECKIGYNKKSFSNDSFFVK